MPTGYTSDVVSGKITNFPEFAMQLSRGMGALIPMRDMPFDAPIPERFESSPYNAERLEEAKAERGRLYAMSEDEAQAAADEEYVEAVARRDKAEAEHAEQRARYDAMIDKVRAWKNAPEGIKEFGLEQLERGRDFDCPVPFKYYGDLPPHEGPKWRAAKLEKIAQDIEYHTVEDAKERARTESRNVWIAQLRASLASAQ